MDFIIPTRLFTLVAPCWLFLILSAPVLGQGTDANRQTPSARIHVQHRDAPALSLEVNGERIKGDGRLRYVGSIGESSKTAHEIRWTYVCDPNPNGGASMEGRFDVDGPFDGWVMIEMPLNPVVNGPAALQLAGSLRGKTDHSGVVLSVARNDHALSFLVDEQVIDQYGRGPFTMQRAEAGATAPRTWSTGEKSDRRQPILVERCRDRLAVRISCQIEEGVEAVFTARIRLVGGVDDFAYRDLEEGDVDGVIPRAEDEISIAVTGVGRGRGSRSRKGVRPNKPAAVVRPVPAVPDDQTRGSAVEE